MSRPGRAVGGTELGAKITPAHLHHHEVRKVICSEDNADGTREGQISKGLCSVLGQQPERNKRITAEDG
jgi:hypothetical protein